MFNRKKKLCFEKAAKFNYEMDINENLKNALKNLSLRRGEMSKRKYLSEMLALFNQEGFDLSLKDWICFSCCERKPIKCCWKKQKKEAETNI